jgi:hypothetical protein
MFETDDAREAELGGDAGELRNGNVVAKVVYLVAQAGGCGIDLETDLDHALIVRVAGPQHHTVFAEGDRVPVSISRDVPDR